ncbi:hypothetical protein QM565_08250 [Geitlerinema splendidum]|nr:hypothetical protein [Geitlerinema splendidum]
MLNANIETPSTSCSRIKISRKINFPTGNFSTSFHRRNTFSVSTAPWHFTTDHQFEKKEENPLSNIKDPLWKHVCREIQDLMPPLFVLKLSECQLGPFLPQGKQVDLYCSEGTVESISQYDFVILTCLQKFFPTLKQVRVKLEKSKNEFTV